MTEVLLGPAGGDHIAIQVLRRKYPQADDYWDGNWLDAQVEVEIKPWRARYLANLRTDEFVEFRRQLEDLYAMTKRDVKFSPMEPWLEFELHLDSLGHIGMAGNIGPEGPSKVFGQARLVFEINEFMDQSFLPPIIKQLTAIEHQFPVVGRPDA